MDWKGRKILITGGNGFIGSHLVEYFVNKRARVRVLVRPSSGSYVDNSRVLARIYHLLDKIEVIWGDVTSLSSVLCAMQGTEYVFHMAGQTHVALSRLIPNETVFANVIGTFNVLEAARYLGVGAVVIPSSDKAYSEPYLLPIPEYAPFRSNSPYDASKAAADQIAMAYFRSYALPVAILRLTNVYGSRQLTTKVIPKFIVSALRDQTLEVYVRSDGKASRRDFLFIDDALDAIVRSVENINYCAGTPINIGSSQSTDIKELALVIIDAVGKGRIKEMRTREAEIEIPDEYVAIDRARELLGWVPTTSLREGIEKTCEWYRAEIPYRE